MKSEMNTDSWVLCVCVRACVLLTAPSQVIVIRMCQLTYLIIYGWIFSRLSHAARRDSSSHVCPWQKNVGKDRKGNAFWRFSPSWFNRSRWNLAWWEVLGGSIPQKNFSELWPTFWGTNFWSRIFPAFFNRSPQNFAWLGVLWSSIP